jgi:hypothetical protein
MRRHAERHRNDRIGWLRAAVLGANDGMASTASLVLGVAAAGAEHKTILLTRVSGLIARIRGKRSTCAPLPAAHRRASQRVSRRRLCRVKGRPS